MIPSPATVALDAGKVIVVPSVPASVSVLLAVSVLALATERSPAEVIQFVPSLTGKWLAVPGLSERVDVEVIQFVPSDLSHFKAVDGASESVAVDAIQFVPSERIVFPEVALAFGKVGVDRA